MLENLTPDQINNLISAGAGLGGALIGASATLFSTWLARKLQLSGKVSLYAKIVHIPTGDHRTWGYYYSEKIQQNLYMVIPVWLDICNTSGISRILRNVNLYAYSNGKELVSFTQIQRSGDGASAVPFGENEAYTVVVSANSAKRVSMLFVLHEEDLQKDGKDFDELILKYFDEKNHIHAFHFVTVEQCWVEGSLPTYRDWITLDRRQKYAR